MSLGECSEITSGTSLRSLSDCLLPSCEHVVQLYWRDHQPVIDNVAAFLRGGYNQGEAMIIVADDAIRRGLTRRLGMLGVDTMQAVRDQQLALFDADDTLCWFMIDRQPDWDRFDSSVGAALRSMRKQSGIKRIRAFGNMVDLLWQRREFSAAIRLEHFWNRAMQQVPCKLFCAYEVDVFSADFANAADGILCTHTHLQGAGLNQAMERALNEALGPEARRVREAVLMDANPARARMPLGEKMILWIRKNMADSADNILSRARHYFMLPA